MPTPRKPREYALARQLRQEAGLPIKQIADQLGVSSSTASRWTRDLALSPRQRSTNLAAASRERAETWRRTSRLKRLTAQDEGRGRAREGDALHQAGCMLYWAEGEKARNTVGFVNSDQAMVSFFWRFLRECFAVTPDRLAVRLNVHLGNGLSLRDVENRWLGVLHLDRGCLRAHVVNQLPTSSSGTRKAKLPHGVCTLRVLRSTTIVQHIYGAIQEYGQFEAPAWVDGYGPRRGG